MPNDQQMNLQNAQSHVKQIQLQLSGDADAVNSAISLLHHLNFMNGALWSQAIRKRGTKIVVRVAAREVRVKQ